MHYSALTSILLVAGLVSCQPIDGGFGDHIAWQSLNSGLAAAKVSQRPVMVLIHRSQCPACHELQPQFAASQEIAELSTKFEMVNAADENEPTDAKFSPDGGYVPRILFFKPDGELMEDVDNPRGHPQYKYYHYEIPSIITAMNKALDEVDQSK